MLVVEIPTSWLCTELCPIQYKASDTEHGKCKQFVTMWFIPKHHMECNKWFIDQKAMCY